MDPHKYKKYEAHLKRNKAFVEFIDEYNQQYWASYYTSKEIMAFAKRIWSLEKHEDKRLARDLVRKYAMMNLDTNSNASSNSSNRSRSSPAASAAPVDEGRAATLALRAASKKREAFLNEGMLGHKAAVAKFLAKTKSKSKS